jgi:hypothetical protein
MSVLFQWHGQNVKYVRTRQFLSLMLRDDALEVSPLEVLRRILHAGFPHSPRPCPPRAWTDLQLRGFLWVVPCPYLLLLKISDISVGG